MGMPVTVGVVGARSAALHDPAFAWFEALDRRFSPHRADSELAVLNAGRHEHKAASPDMRGGRIAFIEQRRGCEGCMIGGDGIATMASGFDRYTAPC